jgi:DNA repair exonuclease SbcCD ATPase subunit
MQKDLKITGIKAKNFKGIEAINVEFSNGHTRIIGLNGTGKSTLKDAVQACFLGVSQKGSKGELIGERFRFIGKQGKAADLEITLEDVKRGFQVRVSNHMTDAKNGITIVSSDGTELDKEWLRDFFNAAFFSADSFLAHTPKEQALLLGIDTAKYDMNIAKIKEDAKSYRREIKDIGAVEDLPVVKRVSLKELSDEKDRIEAHNREQDTREEVINKHNRTIEDQRSRIKAIQESLKREQEELSDLLKVQIDLPQPKGQLVITDIQAKIDAADETNSKAEAYEANEQKRSRLSTAQFQLDDKLKHITKEETKRTDYIKGFKFPLKGLTVDENGGLLLNGRRLNSYSKGEREVIVANLRASQNPNFKTVVIDEFQSLDPENQAIIVDGIINKGNNVITLEVGDKKQGDGSILLRDCAVVDESEENDDRPPAI